jgi:hypothetical protein
MVGEGEIILAGNGSIRQSNNPGHQPPHRDPRWHETWIEPFTEQALEGRHKFCGMARRHFQQAGIPDWPILN